MRAQFCQILSPPLTGETNDISKFPQPYHHHQVPEEVQRPGGVPGQNGEEGRLRLLHRARAPRRARVRRVPPPQGHAHRLRGRDPRLLRQGGTQSQTVLHFLQVRR